MYYCFALKVDSKSYIHSGVHRIFFFTRRGNFYFLTAPGKFPSAPPIFGFYPGRQGIYLGW